MKKIITGISQNHPEGEDPTHAKNVTNKDTVPYTVEGIINKYPHPIPDYQLPHLLDLSCYRVRNREPPA